MNKIARITLFLPLRKIFDYCIPKNLLPQVIVGVRVLVPFGKKNVVGFVVETTNNSMIPEHKLRSIIAIIDLKPMIPENLYRSLLWVVTYYQSSIGAVLDCALPKYYKENKLLINKSDITLIHKKKELDHHSDLDEITSKELKNLVLNKQQQEIIQDISRHIDQFGVSLVDGVTGSGKTEIYLQITKEVLKKNRQILILVPEIGLTPQTLQRFINRFPGIEIVTIHSSMSNKQRYTSWLKAKEGIAKIVLGTRSASFIPLLNPGLFIIDEEHDLSFKQQDHLKYMARDFLIVRAKLENCPVILGSATPSLETLYNIQTKKYLHYKLPHRVISVLPKIEIIDIRHKKLSSGLSNLAIKEIQKHLDQKHQVLLFINRRGFAPVLKCFNCQWVQKCINCDTNMILHIYTNKLHCHYCQKDILIPTSCPSCRSNSLVPLGQGTEKIELLFQKLFPNANIVRIDKDSTAKKSAFSKIITDILEQKVNLLVGTQMIAKGHHFPELALVVIIDLDHALFSSDFRATERLGQLIIQVAGRAGREKLGRVLLQTCYPNNPLIQAISEYNYDQFTSILFKERQISNLPPFSYQILWRAQGHNMKACLKFLAKIKDLGIKFLSTNKTNCQIFGPIPAIMEKRNSRFHARLLFQHNNRIELQSITSLIIQFLELKGFPAIAWSIDVDPKETF